MLYLKRMAIAFGYRIARLYWCIFRPRTYGIKCVVESDGEILFVRHTYGKRRWTFPGGKMEQGEGPEEALVREMKEELGIVLERIRFLGKVLYTREYRRDTVYCYDAMIKERALYPNALEILEVGWYPPNTPPQPLSSFAEKLLHLRHTYT